MNILVLGGTGHIGQRLLALLSATGWAQVTGASRHARQTDPTGVTSTAEGPPARISWLQINSCDQPALRQALHGMDAVVNCVAGDARSIAHGAEVLAQAALQAGRPRIVHLSSMSVYGAAEGTVSEATALDPRQGWYGRAKCEAEAHIRHYAEQGGQAVMFRPGCVHGPGSELWVGRVGRWLQARRLGDLGAAGDGWSNLVHVDDVCRALLAALRLPLAAHDAPVFNLAAPDSPRWNDYFVDLALAIQATPVRRIGRQLPLDAWLAGPPLQVARLLLKKSQQLGWQQPTWRLPDPLPPNLLRLWAQHIRLDGSAASQQLGLHYTPYAASLASSAKWFLQHYAATAPRPASRPARPDGASQHPEN